MEIIWLPTHLTFRDCSFELYNDVFIVDGPIITSYVIKFK